MKFALAFGTVMYVEVHLMPLNNLSALIFI